MVGYSGLGASVHDSGQTHRTGRITQQGRKELRTVLVEAMWRAVECSDYWRVEFERLSRRLPPNKAIVALARKLLVVIWHVLIEQAADRHANADLVAFKFTHAVQCSRGLVVETDQRPTRRADHPSVRALSAPALEDG